MSLKRINWQNSTNSLVGRTRKTQSLDDSSNAKRRFGWKFSKLFRRGFSDSAVFGLKHSQSFDGNLHTVHNIIDTKMMQSPVQRRFTRKGSKGENTIPENEEYTDSNETTESDIIGFELPRRPSNNRRQSLKDFISRKLSPTLYRSRSVDDSLRTVTELDKDYGSFRRKSKGLRRIITVGETVKADRESINPGLSSPEWPAELLEYKSGDNFIIVLREVLGPVLFVVVRIPTVYFYFQRYSGYILQVKNHWKLLGLSLTKVHLVIYKISGLFIST